MNKPTLCLECRFTFPMVFLTGIGDFYCACSEAPLTDFIYGRKKCSEINRGKCPYFQAREVPAPLTDVPPGMNN